MRPQRCGEITLHGCSIFTKAALGLHSKLLYFLGREIFMAHRDDVVLDVNEKPKTGLGFHSNTCFPCLVPLFWCQFLLG